MRLLLYNRNLAVLGGAETLSYNLLKVFAKRHQVTFLTHEHNPDIFPYDSISLIPTSNRFRDNYEKGNAFARQIRGLYDAILMFTPRIGFDLGLLKAEVPITWYCQEPNRTVFADSFSPHLAKQYVQPSLRRRLLNPFFARVERRVAARVRVLCVSNYMVDIVRKALHVTPRVVHPGIVLDRFPFSTVEETHMVSYVGREHFLKNTERLRQAISLVKEKVPDLRFNIGVNAKDLVPIYRETQVVAYVPLDEPFGLVPVEANACGRPCVVSNYGGPSETVLDGVSGLHCNPFDIHDIAEKIVMLLTDIELCRKMGLNGRRRVEEQFTIEQTTRKLEENLLSFSGV